MLSRLTRWKERGPQQSVRLYEALGFKIVGTVPEAFHHPAEGYVGLHIMHRAL